MRWFLVNLPEQKERSLAQIIMESGEFIGGEDQRSDLPADIFFRLSFEVQQIPLVDIADKDQVDNAGILTFGVIINQDGLLQPAQPFDYRLQDLVHAQGLDDHGVEFGKDGVILVGGKQDLPAVLSAHQQVGGGELVEFLLDMAWRGAEFIGQFAQVGIPVGVEEEAHQDADTRL